MFVRYLGGGIGHGENTVDIEAPATPDEEPEDDSDDQPGGNHGREGYDEEEDFLDSDSEGDIENEYSGDEEPEVEL
jgi:hypothetical protein